MSEMRLTPKRLHLLIALAGGSRISEYMGDFKLTYVVKRSSRRLHEPIDADTVLTLQHHGYLAHDYHITAAGRELAAKHREVVTNG